MKIKSIKAREIIDSRGNPTVEVDLATANHSVRAAVPSGASTGAFEAHELRDKDPKRYMGKGVLKAVDHVNTLLAPKLIDSAHNSQADFDQKLLDLDGSENKSKLGANALLGLSLAYAKAFAAENNMPLYKSLNPNATNFKLPVPLMNVINGGEHANNSLDVQEFMIVPTCGGSFKESLRAGCEVFHNLKKIIDAKGMSVSVGDEGGFAPNLATNKEALTLIMSAIEKAGYKAGEDIKIALDVAATEFFRDGKYVFDKKPISAEELSSIYVDWAKEFPIFSIEDGFGEDDWAAWTNFNKAQGNNLQLVGDDLFVTNPKRLQKGIDTSAANSILIKVNQIGTLTETVEAVKLARSNKMTRVMSHRSGETEDTTIADLAVGLDCEQIKTGSLSRGERTAKYNQLLRIEEELGGSGSFWSL